MRIFQFVLFMLFSMFYGTSYALLKIDVSGAKNSPVPLALPVPSSQDQLKDLSNKMIQVIRDDLENSGLFRVIEPEAYLQEFKEIQDEPRFSDWQVLNAQVLLQSQVEQDPLTQELKVSFRLWDIFSNTQMAAKKITAKPDSWRKLAHIVADSIYERLTGDKGYFDSKIVFVSETGKGKHRQKRLAVMDQDGANLQFLTSADKMVMTPRFSPNMRQIAYLSYQDGEPKVYLMDLKTKTSELVGNFSGMSFAPRFSPDGKDLIMSFSQRGNSEIYRYRLDTKEKTKLTNHPAIDTSPSYSPDGQQIVFNSDRGGTQQLYVMNADGANVHRISYGEGTYATPVWSPRGDYIAFTKIKDGVFYIGLMRPDGTRERLIAQGFLVEGPTWSPNGRFIVFGRQERGKKAYIYSIDVAGYNERRLKTPNEATDPTWSPLLH